MEGSETGKMVWRGRPRPRNLTIKIDDNLLENAVTEPFFWMLALRGRGRPRHMPYLCSRSTGAVTSCTRKYLASAGYFRATASYIAYATLR